MQIFLFRKSISYSKKTAGLNLKQIRTLSEKSHIIWIDKWEIDWVGKAQIMRWTWNLEVIQDIVWEAQIRITLRHIQPINCEAHTRQVRKRMKGDPEYSGTLWFIIGLWYRILARGNAAECLPGHRATPMMVPTLPALQSVSQPLMILNSTARGKFLPYSNDITQTPALGMMGQFPP